LALSRDKADARELAPLVDVMERRIRHHLGRARAAALAGPVRAQTALAPRLEALAAVLSKVNADRVIALTIEVPQGAAVACEQQDFDEIAGNLLENAFTWARGTVSVQTRDDGRRMILTIDDDGCGPGSASMRRRRASASDCRSPASWSSSTAARSTSHVPPWVGCGRS